MYNTNLMLIFVFHKRNTIIMKKFTSCSFIIFSLLFISCKKEINEPETIKNIKTLVVVEKPLSKEIFDKDVFPLVAQLYEQDSVKYKMINHIANKAKLEKNKEIYKMNLANLKEELKYVK